MRVRTVSIPLVRRPRRAPEPPAARNRLERPDESLLPHRAHIHPHETRPAAGVARSIEQQLAHEIGRGDPLAHELLVPSAVVKRDVAFSMPRTNGWSERIRVVLERCEASRVPSARRDRAHTSARCRWPIDARTGCYSPFLMSELLNISIMTSRPFCLGPDERVLLPDHSPRSFSVLSFSLEAPARLDVRAPVVLERERWKVVHGRLVVSHRGQNPGQRDFHRASIGRLCSACLTLHSRPSASRTVIPGLMPLCSAEPACSEPADPARARRPTDH